MLTRTKLALAAALLIGAAPAALARQGGTQPDFPRYNEPVAQQQTYTQPQTTRRSAADAYAQAPRRGQPHVQRQVTPVWRGIPDNPPGSAFQDEGNREESGYPGE
jgi:hypothetical protein